MKEAYSRILFLCTGNYYRSRFAEALFNAHAPKLGLAWHADSRGLALERGTLNFGPMSSCVIETMRARGLQMPEPLRYPIQVTLDDLNKASRVIALKEAEHRPLLTARYAGWEERVEYWHVHDIDCATVPETLASIERQVMLLLEELK